MYLTSVSPTHLNMPGEHALTSRPNPPDLCDLTASKLKTYSKPVLKEEKTIINVTQSSAGNQPHVEPCTFNDTHAAELHKNRFSGEAGRGFREF